jgi:hypothetical protein
VLAGGAQRTRLWGRVVEEPGGRTLDVFSVAVEEPVLAAPPSPPPPPVAWRGPAVDEAMPAPVLAVALLEGERALVVSPDALRLLALAGGRAVELSLHALPAPWPARAPGALVACDTRSACWVTTSHMTDAVLVATDGGRITETARADVLPWPGAPAGARFRAGTDLLEAAIPGLPEPPFVQLGAGTPAFAVSPAGWLGVSGAGWLEVASGRAATPLWPGAVLLSSAAPPGASDDVRVVSMEDGRTREDAHLPVAGAVRALAAAPAAGGARVAVVVEDHTGAFRLRVYDLVRREAGR